MFYPPFLRLSRTFGHYISFWAFPTASVGVGKKWGGRGERFPSKGSFFVKEGGRRKEGERAPTGKIIQREGERGETDVRGSSTI